MVKWEADMSFVPSNPPEFFSDKTLARWNTLMPGTHAPSPDPVDGIQERVRTNNVGMYSWNRARFDERIVLDDIYDPSTTLPGMHRTPPL